MYPYPMQVAPCGKNNDYENRITSTKDYKGSARPRVLGEAMKTHKYEAEVIKTTGTHYTTIHALTVVEAIRKVKSGDFEGSEFEEENLKVIIRGNRCKPRTVKLQ